MDIILILKAVILGIVEGITEWLPISSTGHMLLLNQILPLNMNRAFEDMFFVVIQFGAILAVIVMFWEKIFPIKFGVKVTVDKSICKMWLKVLTGCIPAAVLGLLFVDLLERHLNGPITISLMLVIYGAAFIIVETLNKRRIPKITSLDQIDYKTALIIGFFQALSMIPGTSRSGATIIGALIIGVSRMAAAEYTFFLAIPSMFGASIYKLLRFGTHFTEQEIVVLIVGMVVAYLVSLFVIKFLMSYIKKHDFKLFGWYRIILGVLVLAFCIFR